jgi:hypothetical protein
MSHLATGGRGGAKSMKLLVVYAILVVVGGAAAIGVGEIVELTYPSASMMSFLGAFFLMLGGTWYGAVHLTGG